MHDGTLGTVLGGRSNPSLVADAGGDLWLTSQRFSDDLPDAFGWSGDVTDAQQELLVTSKKSRPATETEVLRIRPDGTFATAAGHADAVAVHGDWLYLARAFRDDEYEQRVLVVRTAIPR